MVKIHTFFLNPKAPAIVLDDALFVILEGSIFQRKGSFRLSKSIYLRNQHLSDMLLLTSFEANFMKIHSSFPCG